MIKFLNYLKNICLTRDKCVRTVECEYVIKVNITMLRYHNNYYNLTDVILSTDVTTRVSTESCNRLNVSKTSLADVSGTCYDNVIEIIYYYSLYKNTSEYFNGFNLLE